MGLPGGVEARVWGGYGGHCGGSGWGCSVWPACARALPYGIQDTCTSISTRARTRTRVHRRSTAVARTATAAAAIATVRRATARAPGSSPALQLSMTGQPPASTSPAASVLRTATSVTAAARAAAPFASAIPTAAATSAAVLAGQHLIHSCSPRTPVARVPFRRFRAESLPPLPPPPLLCGAPTPPPNPTASALYSRTASISHPDCLHLRHLRHLLLATPPSPPPPTPSPPCTRWGVSQQVGGRSGTTAPPPLTQWHCLHVTFP